MGGRDQEHEGSRGARGDQVDLRAVGWWSADTLDAPLMIDEGHADAIHVERWIQTESGKEAQESGPQSYRESCKAA